VRHAGVDLRRGSDGPNRRGSCGRRAEEDDDLVCLVVVDDCFLLRGVGAAGAASGGGCFGRAPARQSTAQKGKTRVSRGAPGWRRKVRRGEVGSPPGTKFHSGELQIGGAPASYCGSLGARFTVE
jgi:hypothetical protein